MDDKVKLDAKVSTTYPYVIMEDKTLYKKKIKLDCLKFISQIHRDQLIERRKYEWQIFYATLSFYIVFIYIVLSGKVNLPSWVPKPVWGTILILIAIIVIRFLNYLHRANNTNKAFAEYAEDAIGEMSGDSPFKALSENAENTGEIRWGKLLKLNIDGIWGWCCQVHILLLFSIVSATLVTESFDFGIIVFCVIALTVIGDYLAQEKAELKSYIIAIVKAMAMATAIVTVVVIFVTLPLLISRMHYLVGFLCILFLAIVSCLWLLY